MAKLTGGQAVVESLIAQGIKTVFGIVSVHNLHIFDALRDAVEAGRLKFVGGRHEHALGFMADGYARVTGTPGVMITSSGPGAADSVGAMGESYASSIPVLQITTEIEQEWRGKGWGALHEAKDQAGMFEAVADRYVAADHVEEVSYQIAAALERMRTGHPRPGVVAIPTDLLGREADVEVIPARQLARAEAGPAQVAEAARLLASAERPLLWAGGGVMMSGATAELRELAERLQAPVAVADGGKGAFPDDHPLALGSGLGGRVWGVNPVHDYLKGSDATLVVGTSLPHRHTGSVGLTFPENLVHIDIDPATLGRYYPPKVALVGDAKAVLRQLLGALHGVQERTKDYRLTLQRLKGEVQKSIETSFPNESRLWEAIRSVVERDAVIVSDSAVVSYAGNRCYPTFEPRTYHHPHGWVSIGYGFPASLGMKAALPGRQVVCVTGDGGFQYNMQELGTAVQYGLAPVVIIFNDNAWGALKSYQITRFDGRLFGVGLENPDFRKLADAYAIEAVRVDSLEGLLWELHRALKSERIQLIEVMTADGIASFT